MTGDQEDFLDNPRLADAGYRALIEQIPAVTYIDAVSPSHRTLFVSPQAEELTGYPVSAWIDEPDFWFDTLLHPEDRVRSLELWDDPEEEERGTHTCECRIVTADGTVKWVRDDAYLVRRDDDTPMFWRGVLIDITQMKQAEVALRASEEKFRVLAEQLPAVVYIDSHEAEPRSLYVSPNVEEILGDPVELYLAEGAQWTKRIHPEDIDEVMRGWAESVDSLKPFAAEYRWLRPSSEVLWVRDSAIPVRDEHGSVLYWQGVILDISARRDAEDKLARSRTRFEGLIEQLPAIVYENRRDDERRTLYVSHHVEDVLGYSREEWLDQPDMWMELLHPDDREIVLAAHDLHNETGRPWNRDYRLIASDGRSIWVRDRATLVQQDTGVATWQGLMLDITAEKTAEEELSRARDELEFRVIARTSELAEANEMMSLEFGERRRVEAKLAEAQERYRTLVEHIPAAAYIWEVGPLAGHSVSDEPSPSYISPQIEQLVGFTAKEWLDPPDFWASRVHPHDKDRIERAARSSMRTGQDFSEEFRILRKNGDIVWVLDHSTLLTRDRMGQPELFQGVMIDITARKRAEAEAMEAEARFRSIAEDGPAIPWVLELNYDPEPRLSLRYVSASLEKLLGYELKGLMSDLSMGQAWIHPDDRHISESTLKEMIPAGLPWTTEFRMIAADGRVVWVRSEGRLRSRDEEGRPSIFHGTLMDITETKETEHDLRRSEQLYRALGENIPVCPYIETMDHASGKGRMTYIGPQALEMFGWTPEELLAEPAHFDRMIHPQDRQRVLEASHRADATGDIFDETYRAITKAGQTVTVRSRALADLDEHGRVAAWYGVAFLENPASQDPFEAPDLEAVLGTDGA